jgi:hypothetical protein
MFAPSRNAPLSMASGSTHCPSSGWLRLVARKQGFVIIYVRIVRRMVMARNLPLCGTPFHDDPEKQGASYARSGRRALARWFPVPAEMIVGLGATVEQRRIKRTGDVGHQRRAIRRYTHAVMHSVLDIWRGAVYDTDPDISQAEQRARVRTCLTHPARIYQRRNAEQDVRYPRLHARPLRSYPSSGSPTHRVA